MRLFDLSGKVALITGSTRGIGLSIAEHLSALGASVIISSESERETQAVAERLSAIPMTCDIADPSAIDMLAKRIDKTLGGPDILVSNAGVPGKSGPFATVDYADYDRVMAINLGSMVRLANTILPMIARRGGGAAVLMSSIAGLRGNGQINAYALAKAGVAQLARNLAVEWGPRGVRVNAVSPGLIRTSLSKPLHENVDFMEKRLQLTPLRRIGEVHEIAGAVAFLVSEAGGFVNGHNLVVDGGTTITDGS